MDMETYVTLNTCTLNIRLVANAGKPVFRKKASTTKRCGKPGTMGLVGHSPGRTFRVVSGTRLRLYSIVKADLKIAGKIRKNPIIGEVT